MGHDRVSAPGARPGRLRLWLGALCATLASAAGVALTATSGWLIVRAWQQPVVLMLMVAIVGVRTFGIGRPLLRYVERLVSHSGALSDLAAQRAEAYRRLVPLTPARLGRRGRAEVLTGVVGDLDDVVMASVRWWVPAVSTTLVTVLFAGVLLGLLPSAAGVVLAQGLLVLVVGAVGHALQRRDLAEELAARGDVWRAGQLVATQADAVRAVGGEAWVLASLTAATTRLARATARRGRGLALVSAVTTAGTGVAVAVMALLALAAHRAGGLSAPLAAMVVLTPLALADVWGTVPAAIEARARAAAAGDRLAHLLGQEPAVAAAATSAASGETPAAAPAVAGRRDGVATGPAQGGADVRLEGVTARWAPGAPDALAAVTDRLSPGQRVAVTGPSGAGKSTLLSVVARHLDPSAGRYELDGRDALAAPLGQVRADIAVLDDSPHVFDSTLRENLRLATARGADEPVADEVLVDALGRAGLGGWLASLEGGLDTRLGASGRQVSGGEAARIALARVLLTDRPLVLLDEPVAHLDGPTAEKVMADLGAATVGRTVLIVSHRQEGHEWCDRELVVTPAPRSATPAPRHADDTPPTGHLSPAPFVTTSTHPQEDR